MHAGPGTDAEEGGENFHLEMVTQNARLHKATSDSYN